MLKRTTHTAYDNSTAYEIRFTNIFTHLEFFDGSIKFRIFFSRFVQCNHAIFKFPYIESVHLEEGPLPHENVGHPIIGAPENGMNDIRNLLKQNLKQRLYKRKISFCPHRLKGNSKNTSKYMPTKLKPTYKSQTENT